MTWLYTPHTNASIALFSVFCTNERIRVNMNGEKRNRWEKNRYFKAVWFERKGEEKKEKKVKINEENRKKKSKKWDNFVNCLKIFFVCF